MAGGVVSIHAPWADEQDLNFLLACLATLNRHYLERGSARPLALDGSITYRREPMGEEEWLTLPLVNDVGAGDCEDLAAAYAASYGGVPVVYRSAPGTLHAVVMQGGKEVDPSRLLGMGREARDG